MIKVLLLFGMMGISIAIGFRIKKHYHTRYKIYYEFKNLLQEIKSEISFLKNDKNIILSRISDKCNVIGDFIKRYIKYGVGSCETLSCEENLYLNTILDSIGKNDVEGELNNIDYYFTIINQTYCDVLDKYNRYGGFAVKIAIVIGALVTIILI